MTARNRVAEANVKYLAEVTGQTVPVGYKQTEVGVIPEDWVSVPLMSVGETFIGLTYSPKDVKDFGTLVLRSSNIQHGQLLFEDNVYVQMELPERVITQQGDLLICVRNGSKQLIGKCTLIDERTAGSAFGAFMSLFRSSINRLILYQFQSRVIQRQISEILGATINQITNKDLASFTIVLPSSEIEQTAIANALSGADALINELKKLIAKKQAIKTATMQQLLTGRTRLPQFTLREDGTKKGYKQSELGEIPEDWFETTIANRHQLATGNTPPTSDQSNYGEVYLFVSPADLDESKYIKDTEKKLSAKGFSLARSFPAGSTLFTCIGSTIGKTGLASVVLTSNQQINAVFPNDVDDEEFIYYLLDYISPKVKKLAGEQAVPIVNKSEFGETQYALPSAKEEQTAIATILSDMDAETQTLQKRLTKIRQIKQGMMQELLTGKTRLVQPAPKESANV